MRKHPFPALGAIALTAAAAAALTACGGSDNDDGLTGKTPAMKLELYGNQAGYVAAVTEAANALVAQRLLLPRDAQAQIDRAKATVILP
ncbi:MAG: alpha/beta hydrolase domain-containing protein [Acidovorax sp.]